MHRDTSIHLRSLKGREGHVHASDIWSASPRKEGGEGKKKRDEEKIVTRELRHPNVKIAPLLYLDKRRGSSRF